MLISYYYKNNKTIDLPAPNPINVLAINRHKSACFCILSRYIYSILANKLIITDTIRGSLDLDRIFDHAPKNGEATS